MPSTESKYSKILFKPGFHKESTKYGEEGNWYDGDHVRFRTGRPENIRGWNKLYDTALKGIARDLLAWSNNNTQKLIGVGTNERLSVLYNGYNYDVTPITSIVSAVGSFSTSAGSSLIAVSITNNGVSVNDWIYFTSASINGFGTSHDFAASSFGGPTFQVVSTSGLNVFYISVLNGATSTESNMGTASVNFLLPTQQTVNIQGTGYGAGPYNAGVSTTGGRAWSRAASTSNIVFLANQWSLDNWGEDLIAVRRGGPLIHWQANASTVPVRASVVAGSPSEINYVVVSPNDRHVIALGTNEYGTGTFSPMLVRWSDQNDYRNWVPSVSSTSGEFRLVEGTRIVGGLRARNTIQVWTDKALYSMQFVGSPYTFNITQLGSQCGLVGPHAAITVDSGTYWMSDNNFYVFNGRVQRLDCSIRRDIFDNFNHSQADKVYAGSNDEFNEIIWLIPGNNSQEPSRYVIYNVLEQHWVYGSTFYTTFEDADVFDNTITTGISPTDNRSYIFNNEPVSVYTGDGEPIHSYLESAEFDIDDGDNIMFIDRIVPDFTLKNGTIDFYVNVRLYPAASVTTKGPYNIASDTGKLDFRARGRQASFLVSTSDSNLSWRMGNIRMAIRPDGFR